MSTSTCLSIYSLIKKEQERSRGDIYILCYNDILQRSQHEWATKTAESATMNLQLKRRNQQLPRISNPVISPGFDQVHCGWLSDHPVSGGTLSTWIANVWSPSSILTDHFGMWWRSTDELPSWKSMLMVRWARQKAQHRLSETRCASGKNWQ